MRGPGLGRLANRHLRSPPVTRGNQLRPRQQPTALSEQGSLSESLGQGMGEGLRFFLSFLLFYKQFKINVPQSSFRVQNRVPSGSRVLRVFMEMPGELEPDPQARAGISVPTSFQSTQGHPTLQPQGTGPGHPSFPKFFSNVFPETKCPETGLSRQKITESSLLLSDEETTARDRRYESQV